MTTQEILEAARGAKTAVALSDSGTRDSALLGMADALCAPESMDAILAANAEDMAAAKGRISDVMLDRLALTPQRIEAMAKGIRDVAALPDPVGRVLSRIERPNGLVIEKTAVPMGVIAIIYESRPNVTSDAAALAIKSGNACILRCGKEAWRSANAIVQALRQGLRATVCLNSSLPHRGHHPCLGQRPDDRRRLRGPAHPARRGRTHPCLRRERESPLHPDRHRHLPHLRGRHRRPDQGPGHHRERQGQPPQRLQRRGSLPRPQRHCERVPAEAGPALARTHRQVRAPRSCGWTSAPPPSSPAPPPGRGISTRSSSTTSLR